MPEHNVKVEVAAEREPILVRNRVVVAELVYVSGRGDYKVYVHQGKVYSVRTEVPSDA